MLKNTQKVAILLSSYNGGKYLREQLDSILGQDYADWTLYIRDDGSNDDTLSIIKEYAESYDNIVLINDNCNLGAMKSFFYLMNIVDSAYYMFCDQDDYWLPYKISKSLKELQDLEEKYLDKPVVVGTNLIVTDDQLNVLSMSLFDYVGVNPNLFTKSPEMLYVANPFVGCTLIFNKLCKTILLQPSENTIMHDWWLVLNVFKVGVVKIIPDATIMYRQHANNTVGATAVNSRHIEYWFSKIKNISQVYKRNMAIMRMLYDLHQCSIYKYIMLKVRNILCKL